LGFPDALKASSETMRRTPSSGLPYRAALSDVALETIGLATRAVR